jgi:hypothetical protein
MPTSAIIPINEVNDSVRFLPHPAHLGDGHRPSVAAGAAGIGAVFAARHCDHRRSDFLDAAGAVGNAGDVQAAAAGDQRGDGVGRRITAGKATGRRAFGSSARVKGREFVECRAIGAQQVDRRWCCRCAPAARQGHQGRCGIYQ